MLKKLFILSICFFSPLLANDETIPEQTNLPIGRYQMAILPTDYGSDYPTVFILDTATGKVWQSGYYGKSKTYPLQLRVVGPEQP